MESQKLIVEEKEETLKGPSLVVLYFQRADNPNKTVAIKTTLEDYMERVISVAIKKLGLRSQSIGLLGEGEPIDFIGKTVGEVIKRYNTVTFQLSSADMLG